MERELIQKAVDEAKDEGANLVIWDRRDTFTVEKDDVADLSLEDGYLRVKMEDDKVTVYVDYGAIYKLVVEKERSARSSARAGFGAASG